MKKKNRKLYQAVAALVGTVVGAGFLGIPYVISKSGLLVGAGWMILISIIMMMINLILGEIVLSTKRQHQLPGYSSKYLGRKTKVYIFLASAVGVYAALIAYLIGVGESFSFIFTGTFQYTLLAGIIFWVIMAILAFRGIRGFNKIEPLGVLGILIVVLIIALWNFSGLDFSRVEMFNPRFLFLPFGVIIFAFLGTTAIPEMNRILKKNKKLMKKAIIIGSLIPLIVYLGFTVTVLGLYSEIPEISTLAFGKLVILLGIFTMSTSFLALSLAFEDILRFDYNMNFKKSWILTIILPLIAFIFIRIFNLAGFVKVLSVGGAISGGLLGIAVLLIHEHLKEMKKKRERKPEFKINFSLIIKVLFIILFVVGIIYEFL